MTEIELVFHMNFFYVPSHNRNTCTDFLKFANELKSTGTFCYLITMHRFFFLNTRVFPYLFIEM